MRYDSLGDFITWYQRTGAPGLSKATVQAHITALRAEGIPASSINQRLTAIRKFAQEAADNGLIDEVTAQVIRDVVVEYATQVGVTVAPHDLRRQLGLGLYYSLSLCEFSG